MKDVNNQKCKIGHETKYIVHIININVAFSIQSSVTNELKQNKEKGLQNYLNTKLSYLHHEGGTINNLQTIFLFFHHLDSI